MAHLPEELRPSGRGGAGQGEGESRGGPNHHQQVGSLDSGRGHEGQGTGRRRLSGNRPLGGR